ncbi:maleate cis-trans isomerase family protein [Burkholderia glumae]|uniref:maleate cis-trans isomerase family protein n=1 Tax=Burkholderia glumae TaxID=337 RepID=UPI002036A779|nr:aspartate/glutamate racemase family protein [Burkholderia glumae]MCM2496103.1 aspartate/glutamate racemase family protein [Burkholderia glumae]UVT00155.1 Asp/Glu/hydantoin racemase [Burkholderia glumae]
MKKRKLLGMLTPSSNTTLEPLTNEMLRGLPDVSAHFSRFRVTEISLSESAKGQFEHSNLLRAAELLADAKVDVIAWNGTSASWLGFDADERLCAKIKSETGIPATTSVLALNELLSEADAHTFGLATPYTPAVQERILANYSAIGFNCIAERHLNLEENFCFAEVGEDAIRRMVHEVASSRPKAITTLCTNLNAAHLVPELEASTGIPIFDSVTAVVWKSLQIAGVDTTRVSGWGGVFSKFPGGDRVEVRPT